MFVKTKLASIYSGDWVAFPHIKKTFFLLLFTAASITNINFGLTVATCIRALKISLQNL